MFVGVACGLSSTTLCCIITVDRSNSIRAMPVRDGLRWSSSLVLNLMRLRRNSGFFADVISVDEVLNSLIILIIITIDLIVNWLLLYQWSLRLTRLRCPMSYLLLLLLLFCQRLLEMTVLRAVAVDSCDQSSGGQLLVFILWRSSKQDSQR